MFTNSNPTTQVVRMAHDERVTLESLARKVRPDYFEQRDSLLASGAFSIEDRRTLYPPTGRIYAD